MIFQMKVPVPGENMVINKSTEDWKAIWRGYLGLRSYTCMQYRVKEEFIRHHNSLRILFTK